MAYPYNNRPTYNTRPNYSFGGGYYGYDNRNGGGGDDGKKRKLWIIILCAVLAVAIIAGGIVTAIVIHNKNNGGDGGTETPENPIIEPAVFGYELTDGGTGYEVAGIEKASTDGTYIVPSEVNGLPVTGIKAAAFQNNTNIKKLVLPDSITSLPAGALGGCIALVELSLPFVGKSRESATLDGFENAEACLFYLFGENAAAIPQSLKTLRVNHDVASFALYGGGLGVVISDHGPNYGKYIGGKSDLSIDNLIFGENVRWISIYAFADIKIKHIEFGETGEALAIDRYAFAYTKGIDSLTISARIFNIGASAFLEAPIKTLSFSEGERDLVIGGYAFSDIAITSVHFPDRLNALGSYVFYNAAELKTVTFGADSLLESVGAYVFFGCDNLVELTITSKDIKSISIHAFKNNPKEEANVLTRLSFTKYTFEEAKAKWTWEEEDRIIDENNVESYVHYTADDFAAAYAGVVHWKN
ncbi:MAG: leucine-rich repeat domain-containing protein [Clostridiales bacterium]|jgi:hypothetical protein|nr:leucine-rich repeat domain-containing protein [Clostridiales bacterium]